MAKADLTQPQTPQGDLLLDLLHTMGLKAWQRLDVDYQPYNDRHCLSEVELAVTTDELNDMARNDGNLLTSKCILLPHFTRDNTFWLPAIWITNRTATTVSFQLMLLGRGRRFGFRWESPEADNEAAKSGQTSGNDQSMPGDHDFWHAQPITEARRERGMSRSLDLDHQHICTSFPTFPIDAESPIQLLDAMLVSLYGPNYTVEHIEDAHLRNRIHMTSRVCRWSKARNLSESAAQTGSKNGKGPKKKRR